MGVSYSHNSEGVLHNDNGPAVIRDDGTKAWFINGDRHRIDGPAILYPNGFEEWIQYGLLHRDDGPAIVHDDRKEWWDRGSRHRIDGPALIINNYSEWWINNKNITIEVNEWMKNNNIPYPFSKEHEIQFILTFV